MALRFSVVSITRPGPRRGRGWGALHSSLNIVMYKIKIKESSNKIAEDIITDIIADIKSNASNDY